MRRGRLALGVFSFGLLLVGVCLGLFRWAMAPPPTAPDLIGRAAPRRPAPVVVHHYTPDEGDTAREDAPTWTRANGVLLDGRVSDTEGTPLEGAEVNLNVWRDTTDVDGNYALWVAPGATGTLSASYGRHMPDEREVTMPEEGGATVDLTLSPIRLVEVYCAGLPDDSCLTLEPGVMCTPPALMLGNTCYGEPLLCECPAPDAVIRGGGEAVRVPEDAEVVWLDLRYGGGVAGEVLLRDEPATSCSVQLIRVPRGLVEDLSRGFFAGRTEGCDAEGRFLIEGLKPGVWRVNVTVEGEEWGDPQVIIEEDIVDLGVIDIGDGSLINGVLRDGLTGEPVHWGSVACTLADEGVIAMPVSGATSKHDGTFTLRGLTPGDYLVYPFKNPLEAVEVTLVEGDDAWVELEELSTELPEEQGFDLVTGGAGEILIDAVAEGSAAARAGLSEGDVIAGVKLFGIELSSLHPRLSDAALRAYSGPGMTLMVERDDEALEVALE